MAYSVNRDRADSTGKTGSSTSLDVVSISDEARRKARAEVADSVGLGGQETTGKSGDSPWGLSYGLSGSNHSERTLKNGHTEIIDVDGETLTVREYDGDKLVKSVDGTMADGRAVLDTSYYDKNGKVSQTIHAEMARLETKNGWSGAVMNRSVTWFKNGQIERTLGDEMFLRTKNPAGGTISLSGNDLSRMTGKMGNDTDSLVRALTVESHNLSYHADIQEFYDNKQLSKSLVIDQAGEFVQQSNRNAAEYVDGQGPMSTRELYHDAQLSVVSQEFDRDGNLLFEGTVTDESENGTGGKDGKQYQTVDVSWYKEGELVKHGSGSFRLDEFDGQGLMKRPSVLELLGMSADEYLTPEPQSAPELLGKKLAESSSAPEFFIEGIGRSAAKGQYSFAADMAEYGHRNKPFAVDWTTELYEDGEMVMRKQDSQRARNAPNRGVDDRLPFRTGGGLTEGDRPAVLQSSSHTTEIFENGKTVAKESQETREFLQPDEHGPDTLMTLVDYDRLNNSGPDGANVFYKGGIDEADPDPRAALRSLGAEIDLTMDGVYEMYRNVRGRGNLGNKGSGFGIKRL
ncbi:hypothetical protein [Pseudodesulfovibrio methanolicus]|uniref:Uncharacterized protein n=1 Tax=Pseudodesulfovibrio methanolicus TaxID=3126690 RepID=A0ABZ2IUC9_9BACT